MDIVDLIREAADRNASEIYLSAGMPPVWYINGIMQKAKSNAALSEIEVKSALSQITSEGERNRLIRGGELTLLYHLSDGTTLRCKTTRDNGTLGVSIFIIPSPKIRIDRPELAQIVDMGR